MNKLTVIKQQLHQLEELKCKLQQFKFEQKSLEVDKQSTYVKRSIDRKFLVNLICGSKCSIHESLLQILEKNTCDISRDVISNTLVGDSKNVSSSEESNLITQVNPEKISECKKEEISQDIDDILATISAILSAIGNEETLLNEKWNNEIQNCSKEDILDQMKVGMPFIENFYSPKTAIKKSNNLFSIDIAPYDLKEITDNVDEKVFYRLDSSRENMSSTVLPSTEIKDLTSSCIINHFKEETFSEYPGVTSDIEHNKDNFSIKTLTVENQSHKFMPDYSISLESRLHSIDYQKDGNMVSLTILPKNEEVIFTIMSNVTTKENDQTIEDHNLSSDLETYSKSESKLLICGSHSNIKEEINQGKTFTEKNESNIDIPQRNVTNSVWFIEDIKVSKYVEESLANYEANVRSYSSKKHVKETEKEEEGNFKDSQECLDFNTELKIISKVELDVSDQNEFDIANNTDNKQLSELNLQEENCAKHVSENVKSKFGNDERNEIEKRSGNLSCPSDNEVREHEIISDMRSEIVNYVEHKYKARKEWKILERDICFGNSGITKGESLITENDKTDGLMCKCIDETKKEHFDSLANETNIIFNDDDDEYKASQSDVNKYVDMMDGIPITVLIKNIQASTEAKKVQYENNEHANTTYSQSFTGDDTFEYYKQSTENDVISCELFSLSPTKNETSIRDGVKHCVLSHGDQDICYSGVINEDYAKGHISGKGTINFEAEIESIDTIDSLQDERDRISSDIDCCNEEMIHDKDVYILDNQGPIKVRQFEDKNVDQLQNRAMTSNQNHEENFVEDCSAIDETGDYDVVLENHDNEYDLTKKSENSFGLCQENVFKNSLDDIMHSAHYQNVTEEINTIGDTFSEIKECQLVLENEGILIDSSEHTVPLGEDFHVYAFDTVKNSAMQNIYDNNEEILEYSDSESYDELHMERNDNDSVDELSEVENDDSWNCDQFDDTGATDYGLDKREFRQRNNDARNGIRMQPKIERCEWQNERHLRVDDVTIYEDDIGNNGRTSGRYKERYERTETNAILNPCASIEYLSHWKLFLFSFLLAIFFGMLSLMNFPLLYQCNSKYAHIWRIMNPFAMKPYAPV